MRPSKPPVTSRRPESHKKPAGVNRQPTVPPSSILADKLFRPPAPFASESYEVRFGFPDFMPR